MAVPAAVRRLHQVVAEACFRRRRAYLPASHEDKINHLGLGDGLKTGDLVYLGTINGDPGDLGVLKVQAPVAGASPSMLNADSIC
jgi:hypothetical protein